MDPSSLPSNPPRPEPPPGIQGSWAPESLVPPGTSQNTAMTHKEDSGRHSPGRGPAQNVPPLANNAAFSLLTLNVNCPRMKETLQATVSGPQCHPLLPRHCGRCLEESKRRQFFLALKVMTQSSLPAQPPSVLSEKTWLKGLKPKGALGLQPDIPVT